MGSWVMQLGDKEVDWNETNSKITFQTNPLRVRGFLVQDGKFHSEKRSSREKGTQSVLRMESNEATWLVSKAGRDCQVGN